MRVEQLFIATTRADTALVSVLVDDLSSLGYGVSFDSSLPGGARWWAATLDAVAASDAFVYAVTRESVDSTACQHQMQYAFALGKPVLPVLLDDDVSDVDLPTDLGAIQHVDYRKPTSAAMAALFSALRGLTSGAANASIDRPVCPPEYAFDAVARLAEPAHLTRAEQDAILDRLDAYAGEGYTVQELEPVLRGLRERQLDLAATTSARLDEIDRGLLTTRTPALTAPVRARSTPSGEPPVRSLFASYSRSNRALVDRLVGDARMLGFTVWIDQNLPGGKRWWDQVLQGICDMDVFAFAISAESLTSRACLAELGYARQLGKPIAGFQIADDLPPDAGRLLEGIQLIRYVPDDKGALAAMARVLTEFSCTTLPAQLPPAPEVPATYTFDVQNQLRSPNELDPEEQATLVAQIKQYAAEGVSPVDVSRLVATFRNRPDVTNRTLSELDAIDAQLAPVLAALRARQRDESDELDESSVVTHDDADDQVVTIDETDAGEADGRVEENPPPPPPPPSPPESGRKRGRLVAGVVGVAVVAGGGAAAWAVLGGRGADVGTSGTDPPITQPQPTSPGPTVITTPPVDPTAPPIDTTTTVDPTTTIDSRAPLTDPTTPAVDPLSFGGVTGSTTVDWVGPDGNAYEAVIETSGPSGIATVSFFDATGAFFQVQQSLTLLADQAGPFYRGSSPLLVPSGIAATWYSPDDFRLAQQANGLWTFVAVCDAAGCYDAFIV